MVKLIRLCVLGLLVSIAAPRLAAADMTNAELRRTLRAAEYWLTVDFPLSAAAECDQRRGGASGTWDESDHTCNVNLERLAALITLVSEGAFVPADMVTAWCSAAETVRIAKEALEAFRRGPDMSQEARNQRAWDSMWGYQQQMFIALNSTLAIYISMGEFED